ncbi:SIR2 family NAD-dependent protein deacylase [Spiractinospora alimapuensis]|uniref:SIR2 family NAD-dependent protein deacylase n=1 Tax=Spiractinospora alimapuensis TaxID=2820884 RepID=UPI001F15B3F1|nr:Sir2 family NAD-dependent protein deacetylase [Spiractinospora alimapuensis]
MATDVETRVRSARRVGILTGAGISTDSGIPDFRGPNGVWTRSPDATRLFDYDTYMSEPDVRREVWRMRRDNPAWEATPNAAHRAIADMDAAGRLSGLVTQNIDGLHQAAGMPAERVIEVHGTLHWVLCMACGLRTPTRDVLPRLDSEPDPACPECGGIQKVDTISFGQTLKTHVLEAAAMAAAECDVFLAIGTTLTVNPAAGLCDVAMDHGADLIVVNADPTPYDDRAVAVIRDPIVEAVPALLRANEG